MQQVTTTTQTLVNGLEKVELRLALYGRDPMDTDVVSCALNLGCSGGEGFSIGNACPQSARLVLEAPSALGIQGELVQLTWSVSEGWYPLFTGYVTRERVVNGRVELEVNDALYVYGSAHYEDQTTSLSGALDYIAGALGTTLSDDIPDLTLKTADFSDLPANSTCAKVLAMVAGLLGCNAFLDRSGRLTLRPYRPVDFSGECYEGGWQMEAEDFVPQGLTFLRIGEDATGALGEQAFSAGDGSLVLENPLANQFYVDLAWSQMSGLAFGSGQFSIPGGLLLEPGDIIALEGKAVACAGLGIAIDGGVKADVISCGEVDEGGARGSLTNRVDGAVNRMERIQQQVMAEKSAREQAVEELNAALADASGLYATAQTQSDGSLIQYLHDKPALEDSELVIKIAGEGIGISRDGGGSYSYGFTFDGDAILNELYATGIYGVKIIGETGSMGGFTMTEHTLSADFRYEFPAFTSEDIAKAQAYILGTGTLTDEEKRSYDVNMDGRINSLDLFVMQRMMNGLEDAYTEGSIVIDSADPRNCIRMEVTGGYRAGEVTFLGMGGVSAGQVNANAFSCGDDKGVSASVPAGAALTVKGGLVTGYGRVYEATLQYDVYPGFVTGSTKNLYFTIPLAGVATADAVSLTGQVTARGVNGYLNGTTNTDSLIDLSGGAGYTVSALVTACGIRVQVTFDEAIANATNNTPATVTPYGVVTAVFDYD